MSDDDYIAPVDRSRMARTGHAVNEASRNALGYGASGFGIGSLLALGIMAVAIALPVAVGVGILNAGAIATALGNTAGLSSWGSIIQAGVALVGAGVTAVVSIGTGLALAGTTMFTTTAVGAGYGAIKGASHSVDQTGQEQAAAQYQAGYMTRMAQHNFEQAQAQQMAYAQQMQAFAPPPPYMQPPVAPVGYTQAPLPAEPLPQVASAPVPQLQQTQSEIRVAEPAAEMLAASKPETKISLAAIEHARLTPELSVAKG